MRYKYTLAEEKHYKQNEDRRKNYRDTGRVRKCGERKTEGAVEINSYGRAVIDSVPEGMGGEQGSI